MQLKQQRLVKAGKPHHTPFVQGFSQRTGSQETNTWDQWLPETSPFQVFPASPLSRITACNHAPMWRSEGNFWLSVLAQDRVSLVLLLCDSPVSDSHYTVGIATLYHCWALERELRPQDCRTSIFISLALNHSF